MPDTEDSNCSIINSCPPEIWSQIFYSACTDTGFTGRSISSTSRYFHEIAKKIRLRSVALFSIKQIIAFVKLVEALPLGERLVENLYITTYDSAARESIRSLSKEFYKPGFETRGMPPSMEIVLNSYYELSRHGLMRILFALAPTLKHLHIFFEGRRFLLPSVNLPHLEELVVEGYYSYSDEEFANERLPLLRSLRRLRLTCVHPTNGAKDNTLRTIVASAPNLTHLRLDYFYFSKASDAIQKFLPPEPTDAFSPPGRNPVGNEQFHPQGVKTLPKSLHRMLLHPGSIRQPRYCRGEEIDDSALRYLAFVDPRLIFFERDPFTMESVDGPQKGLAEWMDRINGRESY